MASAVRRSDDFARAEPLQWQAHVLFVLNASVNLTFDTRQLRKAAATIAA